MSDDYQSTIASLELARDIIASEMATIAQDLANVPVVPTYSESGDGGSESIDVAGLRRQLTDEMSAKAEQVKQISITIASLSSGINVMRLRGPRICRR